MAGFDRVDIMEEPEKNRVYVKVIDYKTGNTSFDMLALYHGLQLQLMIYLDGALKVEQRKYPEREIVPAGIFYYNVKDPMIQEKDPCGCRAGSGPGDEKTERTVWSRRMMM